MCIYLISSQLTNNLKIPGYEGKCCTTSITFEAAGSKSKAAKKWSAYVGGPYHFWDIHNGAPVYRMSTISKSLLHKDVDRFIFLNDDGKWTVNNKINDRGVFRKGRRVGGVLGCPEDIDDWSFWNEEEKKWESEKASLFAKCDPPPSSDGENSSNEAQLKILESEEGNNCSTVENGRMVISYQL